MLCLASSGYALELIKSRDNEGYFHLIEQLGEAGPFFRVYFLITVNRCKSNLLLAILRQVMPLPWCKSMGMQKYDWLVM